MLPNKLLCIEYEHFARRLQNQSCYKQLILYGTSNLLYHFLIPDQQLPPHQIHNHQKAYIEPCIQQSCKENKQKIFTLVESQTNNKITTRFHNTNCTHQVNFIKILCRKFKHKISSYKALWELIAAHSTDHFGNGTKIWYEHSKTSLLKKSPNKMPNLARGAIPLALPNS